ncbi:uncharacterized protein N7500_007311 [Penicillium coprophilum]|uniref:uncharacterized protein n=1 Tax=Penicillium coprophilum TaxID=36646 RepID=UPI00239E61C2|nr:uncharacterized protein N7500_007311 [Penicillium coprophilum]KAJ5165481.1 hypothetical protein N7500_007311 [Penicillium coprophilum]
MAPSCIPWDLSMATEPQAQPLTLSNNIHENSQFDVGTDLHMDFNNLVMLISTLCVGYGEMGVEG